MTVFPVSPIGSNRDFAHEEKPERERYKKTAKEIPNTTAIPFFMKSPHNFLMIVYHIKYKILSNPHCLTGALHHQ
jgi:hypothetical protein